MKRVAILAAAAGALLLVAFGAAACGDDGKTSTQTPSSSMRDAGSITVTGVWARKSQMAAGGMATPASGGMMTPGASIDRGAAYMLIKNSGSAGDALIGATSDVADKTEVHETKMVDGNATMSPVARIEVPAGGSVELKPGSYHVMFIGLKQPLTVGAKITINLQFEKAGTIPVEAEVREQ